MAEQAVDYDRPTIIRIEPTTGMDVCMYKDAPGVYFTSTGKPVPEALAAKAGFNVEANERLRIKRERIRNFAQTLEQEELQAELEVKQGKPKEIVHEADGFKVVALGPGRHAVEDPDGNTLSRKTLALEVAKKLVDEMAESERKKRARAAKPETPAA